MQRIISIIVTFFMVATAAQAIETSAKNAYVIDVSTGAVMMDRASSEAKPPASMSKLMTIAILFKSLKAGDITLDSTFTVSEKAWKMGGSKMFVELGSEIRVEDLIKGIVIQSGNDACIVVAEGMAGTEDQFAEQMNTYAAELGMTNSSFGNSSGWPHPKQRMSAKDLATLAYFIYQNYPEYIKYFSQPDFTYNKIKQANRNPLLGVVKGANGMKTGHTNEAGYGLVGSVERDGRHIIMVLMGIESQSERASEAGKIASWALGSFTPVTHFKSGDTMALADTWMGEKPIISLGADIDFVTLDPLLGDTKPTVTLNYNSPISTPITKGTQVGTISVKPAELPEYTIPLVATQDMGRGGFVTRYLDTITNTAKQAVGAR